MSWKLGRGGEWIEFITLSVRGCEGICFYVSKKSLGAEASFYCIELGDRERLEALVRKKGRIEFIAVGDHRFKQEEPEQQQTVEEPTPSQSVPEWVLGTWTYTQPGVGTATVIINNSVLRILFDGDLVYNGAYELRGAQLHYNIQPGQGSNYIDLDLSAHWLKYDEGPHSYMQKLVRGKYVYPDR